MNKNTIQIVQKFLDLQHAYAFTKRMLVTGERYKELVHNERIDNDDYGQECLRESLTEHVGHLPIMATFFHPYVEKSSQVDLGRVLQMLAVHDIGETRLGDILTYDKTEQDSINEQQAAIEIMHPNYVELFKELELGESLDAKFANSMDKLAPSIHEADMPRVTLDNFDKMGYKIQTVIDRKRSVFEWDPFLLEVFDVLMEHFIRVENNKEPIFQIREYDKDA